MLVLYQLLLNFIIVCLVAKLKLVKEEKSEFVYSLLFLVSCLNYFKVNHIIDRYPADNHYIISLLLVCQFWSLIKNKIFNLAVPQFLKNRWCVPLLASSFCTSEVRSFCGKDLPA